MAISKPFKGIATGKVSHENANQYTRVFYGDQNLCEQWITYAQTILTQMLMLPGTQTRHVMATPDVSVNVTCRPNRIEINAGGEKGYVTYPDILGATGDVDNFGYDDRIIHKKNFKYVKKQTFYAGSNRMIQRTGVGVSGTGGNTFGFVPSSLRVDTFNNGYTARKDGKNVVSWCDNVIYINGFSYELHPGEHDTKRIIGAVYSKDKVLVMRVNIGFFELGGDTGNGGVGGYGYVRINIDKYSVAFDEVSVALTYISTYVLTDLVEDRVYCYPVFLDETCMFAFDSWNSRTFVGIGDDSSYGKQYMFDDNLDISSVNTVYTNFTGSTAQNSRPDYIFSHKGGYVLSFIEQLGANFMDATVYITTRLLAIKNGSGASIAGTGFVNTVNVSTFYTSPCGHQYIFVNEKLSLFVYLVYQPVFIDSYGAAYKADIHVKLKGNVTVFDDIFTETYLASHPSGFIYKHIRTAFDGDTLIICFLDYSLIIDCTKTATLTYVELNYRLDGADCTDAFAQDDEITPLSVTECKTFTPPILTYT